MSRGSETSCAIAVNCYASSASYQVPLATLTGLDPTTPHTVTVKVLGTKNAASTGTTIIFDAFETRQLASFTDSYAYDPASRVTSWMRAGEGATQVAYGYDAAGNLETLTRDSVTTEFTQDADNRLTLAVTGSSVTTYTNDLYGRRTSEITSEDPSATPVATTYTWDAMGHLAGVSLDGGATVCSYSYGASGMRESASVTEGTTTSTTKSFWLGSALTAEIDSVGGVNGTRYDYLWRADGTPLALAVTPSGGATSVFHYQTDAFGSVIAITDSSGGLVASYTYGAYGEVLTATGYGASAALAERNPLRHRGYYYDTATGLYYLPARYYDPGTCRFLSADPAGPSAGDPLALNAYAYCAGDPVNLEDPSGAKHDCGGGGGYAPPPCPPVDTEVLNTCHSNEPYSPPTATIGSEEAGQALALGALAVLTIIAIIDPMPGDELLAFAAWGRTLGAGAATTVAAAETTVIVEGAAPEAVAAAEMVPIVAEAATVHGNAIGSSRMCYLYQLFSKSSGTYLKTGISQNPNARYTASFMADKTMRVLTSGSRAGMLALERQIVTVDPGPLNREPWAVAGKVAGVY